AESKHRAASRAARLAAKKFDNRDGKRNRGNTDDLGELEHECRNQGEQPELLRHHAADQEREAVLGDAVGAGVEVLVALAAIVGEVREKLARGALVDLDPLRIG